MTTTVDDIRRWLERAEKDDSHMIVVCDTFDHEDYPVFVNKDMDIREAIKEHDGQNMQRIMEVYNLSMSLEDQLASPRVYNV